MPWRQPANARKEAAYSAAECRTDVREKERERGGGMRKTGAGEVARVEENSEVGDGGLRI